MINFLPYIILLLAFSSIFILVSQYFSHRERQKLIKERFASAQKKELEKPFWMEPLLKPLAPINEHIGNKRFREHIRQRLLGAGSPLSVNEYFVFKEVMVLFMPLILAIVIGWDNLLSIPILVVAACGFGFIYPDFWLKVRTQKRRKDVLRALPSIIDLLTLAVDAGLDFMIAVRRVVEHSRPGPMVDELSFLWQEVQMGRVRRDALRSMAKRLDLAEVHSFTRTLIQAERMGTPMGEALRTLSDEIRMRQFQRGEQQALKAPIKMLFPLLFCILPVVLILVGGPVILQFFQTSFQFFK
ncbi:MAG: type II secretion system F family protein [Candidatus Omnitrophota bacterium]|nr:MAG: type II secretion system F family protein [Candidatus Omnitrophota bacterium]